MSVVRTDALVRGARAAGGAVLAVNVVTLEHAEAVTAAAEEAGRPVILQVSENAVAFHGALAPLAAACRLVAEASSAPVALHLDHVTDWALLREAADRGFSSVMFDAGARPYRDNVRDTRAAADWAHGAGLWIEAELGHVGGKDTQVRSAHADGVRTDPLEARAYVDATGVDALAVAVGSRHAMRTRSARLDHDLVARLREASPVPLVLHGSSGVAGDELRAAVGHGITKVNVGTAVGAANTATVRAVLAADSGLHDPRRYLAPARAAMRDAVLALLFALPEAVSHPPECSTHTPSTLPYNPSEEACPA
jgi:fructose-bisphosphate aldolase class II